MSIVGTSVDEVMNDYWRPSISSEKKETIEYLIEENPELPFASAKEFMDFAINRLIFEVETGMPNKQQQKEELRKLIEDL